MTQPGLPFHIFIKNTTYVTLLIMVGDVLTCSMAAFAFARLRFPNRDKLFILVISTMMLPDVATMVPTFLLFNAIGWVDTLQPLWIRHWFAGSAFNIFLFRQFFRTIPFELDEAARIDGAGTWRIWLRVVMPLSQPVIATIAIFSFIAGWTDFLDPVIYINSMDKRTIALGLQAYIGAYASSWHFLMAATTITTLPIVIIFLTFQRFFVRGISMTGIAGR
jgi:multiple sugar transport system permease protein